MENSVWVRNEGFRCITESPRFQTVVTDVDVLRTVLVEVMDLRRGSLEVPLRARVVRLAAYRQFT